MISKPTNINEVCAIESLMPRCTFQAVNDTSVKYTLPLSMTEIVKTKLGLRFDTSEYGELEFVLLVYIKREQNEVKLFRAVNVACRTVFELRLVSSSLLVRLLSRARRRFKTNYMKVTIDGDNRCLWLF